MLFSHVFHSGTHSLLLPSLFSRLFSFSFEHSTFSHLSNKVEKEWKKHNSSIKHSFSSAPFSSISNVLHFFHVLISDRGIRISIGSLFLNMCLQLYIVEAYLYLWIIGQLMVRRFHLCSSRKEKTIYRWQIPSVGHQYLVITDGGLMKWRPSGIPRWLENLPTSNPQ